MAESLNQYRQQLIEIEQKIGAGYDKTLITLSGGALGVSFAFIKSFIGEGQIASPLYALFAWCFWAASLTFLLTAFYFGSLAYRYAIKMLDANKLNKDNPGGYYAIIINILNILGGLSFILGVALFITFSFKNLGG